MATWWKLAVAPLQAGAKNKTVVVRGDNWLAGLRAGRAKLGEPGGVPIGASCVFRGEDEVTVLDPAGRRRFELSRTEHEIAASGEDAATSVATDESPILPREVPAENAGSEPPAMAADPEELAPVGGCDAGAPADDDDLDGASSEPSPPDDLGDALPPSPATALAEDEAQQASANGLDDSAAAREEEASARHNEEQVPSEAEVTAADAEMPPASAAADDQAAVRAPGDSSPPILTLVEDLPSSDLPAPPEEPVASIVVPASAPAPSLKGSTLAYSSAESAAVRAQLLAAAPAPSGRQGTLAYSPEQSAAIREGLAARGRELGVGSPKATDNRGLVLLSSRDEEPSETSKLSYRERCYYTGANPTPSDAEAILRDELGALRRSLTAQPRGKLVNLALFDHVFQGTPQRGPVATLEWKDWRDEAAFTWHGLRGGPTSLSTRGSGGPPPTSAAPAPRSAPSATFDAGSGKRVSGAGAQDGRLAAAFEATQDLYFLRNAAEGLSFAVKLLGEMVPCEAISGCVYDINTDEFRFVAADGAGGEERRATSIPSSLGLFAIASRSGEDALIVRRVQQDPRFNPAIDSRPGLSPETMIFLPLMRADNLLGMLQLINPRAAEVEAPDIAVAVYIAGQVAEFMQNKRSHHAAR